MACGQTSVSFPLNSLFGGAAYGKSITITAANTLISDGQNLWAGTYTIIPASTTNPVVALYPNTYLMTVQGVATPVRFSVPASTNVLDVTTLLVSGPLFYFGTNSPFLNLAAGTNISFSTNGYSVTINESPAGYYSALAAASNAVIGGNWAVPLALGLPLPFSLNSSLVTNLDNGALNSGGWPTLGLSLASTIYANQAAANAAQAATNHLSAVASTGSAASLTGTLQLSALPSSAVTNLYFPNAFPASKMVLWLNGDSIVGTNGQVVTNWPDVSGNGNNATNVANNGVVINTNSLNGHRGVTWQSGGSFLTTIAPLNPGNQTTIVTVSTHTSVNLHVLWEQPGNNYMYYAGATGGSLNGIQSAGSVGFGPYNEPMAQIFLLDTNQVTIRQNGIGKQIYGSSNYLLTNNMVFGAELGGAYSWQGDLDEVIVFNYVLSLPEIYAVESYLEAKYKIGTGSKIMCIGDSLTDGVGGTAYPLDLCSMLNTNYGFAIYQLGQYGQTALGWLQNAQPFLGNTHNVGNDVAILWLGSNDIKYNYGAGAAFTNIAYDCQLLHSYGYRVIVGTMIARADINDTNRIALNGLVTSGWTNFADVLADFGSDAILGNTNNCANTNYYQSDTVHLTSVGYQRIANIAYQALIYTLNIGGQYTGTFTGNGVGVTNISSTNIVGGLNIIITNLWSTTVSNRLFFTNGILVKVTTP